MCCGHSMESEFQVQVIHDMQRERVLQIVTHQHIRVLWKLVKSLKLLSGNTHAKYKIKSDCPTESLERLKVFVKVILSGS